MKEHGLEQVSDAGLVESVVEQVFADNPKSIADYQAGQTEGLRLPGGPDHEAAQRARRTPRWSTRSSGRSWSSSESCLCERYT